MSDVDARLEQLRVRFLARCQADLADIKNPFLPSEALQKIAHRIAGMAGTVGLSALGDAAFALDQDFRHGTKMAHHGGHWQSAFLMPWKAPWKLKVPRHSLGSCA